MASMIKTQGIDILSHQAVTHPNTAIGGDQDVTTKLAATIVMFHASIEAVVNTNPGSFLLQVSASGSGNEDWATIHEFTARVSTADTEAMTATEPVGETALVVASTAGFTAGDTLYIQDTTTEVNSEWGHCQEIVTNTSINLFDGLTNEKDSADVIWNDADIFIAQLDLTAVGRLRVVFQQEGAVGANSAVKAVMITGDSIG